MCIGWNHKSRAPISSTERLAVCEADPDLTMADDPRPLQSDSECEGDDGASSSSEWDEAETLEFNDTDVQVAVDKTGCYLCFRIWSDDVKVRRDRALYCTDCCRVGENQMTATFKTKPGRDGFSQQLSSCPHKRRAWFKVVLRSQKGRGGRRKGRDVTSSDKRLEKVFKHTLKKALAAHGAPEVRDTKKRFLQGKKTLGVFWPVASYRKKYRRRPQKKNIFEYEGEEGVLLSSRVPYPDECTLLEEVHQAGFDCSSLFHKEDGLSDKAIDVFKHAAASVSVEAGNKKRAHKTKAGEDDAPFAHKLCRTQEPNPGCDDESGGSRKNKLKALLGALFARHTSCIFDVG